MPCTCVAVATPKRVLAGAVEGAPLMRVLAVAERIGQRPGDDAALRREVAHGLGEPGADGRIVSAGAGKGLGRERLAKLQRGRSAILLHLVEHAEIIGGIDDDGDARMVLGAGADQRRAADIDVLDASGEIRAARRRALEGIEIDGEKVDLGDGVIFERLLVTVLAAHREQPAVDFRVQRLHPPIHHLGDLRDLGDVGHLEACLAQRPWRCRRWR